ncbi:MAG: hypothetical protein U9Q69_03340 [Nanoarchaeota archaeon]|nr:hypothetical protein [Nanoarchaeota archaeon]
MKEKLLQIKKELDAIVFEKELELLEYYDILNQKLYEKGIIPTTNEYKFDKDQRKLVRLFSQKHLDKLSYLKGMKNSYVCHEGAKLSDKAMADIQKRKDVEEDLKNHLLKRYQGQDKKYINEFIKTTEEYLQQRLEGEEFSRLNFELEAIRLAYKFKYEFDVLEEPADDSTLDDIMNEIF